MRMLLKSEGDVAGNVGWGYRARLVSTAGFEEGCKLVLAEAYRVPWGGERIVEPYCGRMAVDR